MLPRFHRFTLEQRITISRMLNKGATAQQIADVLNVDPTSVSKEVKRNRELIGQGAVPCQKTNRFPHVCDGCEKKYVCKRQKYTYRAQCADAFANDRKRATREGVDCDLETVLLVQEALRKEFPNGIGTYKALAKHKLLDRVRPTTVYGWIHRGVIDVGPQGMARQIKTKERNKNYQYPKCPLSKKGHEYLDYLHFYQNSDVKHTVQMDFLGSPVKDRHAILVLYLDRYRFPMLFKLPKGSNKAVLELFHALTDELGIDDFRKVFPAILTDNDPAFWCFKEIEVDSRTREPRTNVFFCDSYMSNQKAGVENVNSQVRRFIRKKARVDDMSGTYIAENNIEYCKEPLKSLYGISPAQAVEAAFGKEVLDKLFAAIRKLNK